MNTPLVDVSGRLVSLGAHIADGGEGSVYSLATDSSQVVKIYFDASLPDANKIEKLTAMICLGNTGLQAVSAWPTALVYRGHNRQLCGFVMPKISNSHWIQKLYNPLERMKYFPHAGWNFQVCAARNFAAAFDEVHKAGWV